MRGAATGTGRASTGGGNRELGNRDRRQRREMVLAAIGRIVTRGMKGYEKSLTGAEFCQENFTKNASRNSTVLPSAVSSSRRFDGMAARAKPFAHAIPAPSRRERGFIAS